MSKYDALWKYIKNNKCDKLSFNQIEEICGFKIDHSFLTYKKELLEYGYSIGKISMKEEMVYLNKESNGY